ncbi:MAG: O-antigen ligase family protein [Actinomycetota bacterium]|nr:O-antigen ligase family protein [Actinomycetota bacterium]
MENTFLSKNKIMNIEAKEMVYILFALLPAFILMNKYPYFTIFSIITMLLMSVYYFIRNKEISRQHLRADILLGILALYLLFSYFISGQPFMNLFDYWFIRYDGNFFFSYSPFIILAVPFISYRKAAKIYFKFLFIAFTFFAVIGFLEYINDISSFMVRIDDIYVGPMFIALNNSHNATGSVYSIAGIFAFAFFLESQKKEKIAYGFISILFFIAIITTKSRGSMVAFAIGIFFLLLFGSGSLVKFLRNFFIIILVAVPFVFITGTFVRVMQIFHIYDLSALTRFSLWDKAILLFKQSPIAGIGFARYNDVPWNFDKVPLSGNPGIFAMYTSGNFIFNDTNAHSSYLHFLAETGIIGLVLAMAFWIFCLVIIYKAYRKTGDSFSRKVYLSVAGGIITLFMLSVTENYMTAPTVMVCLSLATSLAIGMSGRKEVNAGGI